MDMTQIESARSNVEKLQYELGQTQDPGQRSELEGRLMDAQSQLVALSEQQYANTASEHSSSETAKEGEWVKTRSEATVSRDSSPGRIPSVFDAMGLNDKVSVRETYVQMDATQRDLYERGIAYQEFGPNGGRPEARQTEQPRERGEASTPAMDSSLQISAGQAPERMNATEAAAPGAQTMPLEVAADPEKLAAHQAEQQATKDAGKPEPEQTRQAQDSGMEARHMEQGEELSGEIVEAVEVDGKDYYTVVIDNEKTGEPERVLVPAGDTEHEPGDEITARHTPQGVEIEEAYGYGR